MTEWLNTRQAAAALGITERSVLRRIAGGKLPNRLDDAGRRLVAVELPDVEPDAVVTPVMTADTVVTDDDVTRPDAGHDSGMLSVLVDDARRSMQVAVVTAQQLARLSEMHADRYRSSSRIAWALVGLLTVVVMVAVGFVTFKLTRTDDQLRQLTAAVAAAQVHQVDPDRDQLNAARPAALVMTPSTQPTTRPTLLTRLASLLDDR